MTDPCTLEEAMEAARITPEQIAALEARGFVVEASQWRPLETAPRAKFGETWLPRFLLGREGMAESVALGRFQTCLDGAHVLEVTRPDGVRAHEDIPFTHWRPLFAPPIVARPQEQKQP